MAETTDARSDTVRRTAILLISVLSLKYVVLSDAASVGPHDHGDDSAVAGSRQRDVVDGQRSSANCTECGGSGAHQVKRDSLIELVKSYILHRLRLEHPPQNVTVMRLPSDWSLDEKSDQRETHSDTDLERLLLSFPVNGSTDTCQFEFQQDMRHRNIVSASIGIYVRRRPNPRETSDAKRTRIHLYQVRGDERVQVYSRSIRTHGESRWLHFDVTLKVYNWLHGPSSSNFQLQVEAHGSDGASLAIVNPTDPNDESFKPYMKIYSNDQLQNRSKRSTTDHVCAENLIRRRCSRLPLTIDFASLGWDWVIMPKRLQAFHCAGGCFDNRGPGITYGHGVQQQQQAGGIPTTCCSPRRLSPITMLFRNDANAVEKVVLPNMVVEECGCS